MTAEKRRKYTTEFKWEAVSLATEQGNSIAKTARNLGLNENMLGRWVREQSVLGNDAFPGKGRLTPEQEELQRLRAENKRLRMERDILKKRRPSSPRSRTEISVHPGGEGQLPSRRAVSCSAGQPQ